MALLYTYTWYRANGAAGPDMDSSVPWRGPAPVQGQYTRVECTSGAPSVSWYDDQGEEIAEQYLPWNFDRAAGWYPLQSYPGGYVLARKVGGNHEQAPMRFASHEAATAFLRG